MIKEYSPFIFFKNKIINTNLLIFLFLIIIALVYSFYYNSIYILKFILFCSIGLLLELLYFIILEGKIKLKSGSSVITAGLLMLSIPANFPFLPILYSLIFAIFFIKLPAGKHSILFNPVLAARLFLMLSYNKNIVNWNSPNLNKAIDSLTTATPLEFYQFENVAFDLFKLLFGKINETWEELYQIVPGAPGEIFPLIIILFGFILFFKGILKWRISIAFILTFTLTNLIIKESVLFNLFTGSIIFSSVFIAGDPKTTPMTKSGQIIGGIIAGIVNALIRKYTYYSEGIVFAFLLVNLLSPLIDNISFTVRGLILNKKVENL